MDNDAMIMIMDYKDYQVPGLNSLLPFFSTVNSYYTQGEERPFLIAFKHGLEEEKV